MTIFIAHAPQDRESAEGLEKALERRGLFVELDDGETALRSVESADTVALLLSQDFASTPHRLRLEQRALDAWSEGRLIVIKLDQSLAPVGLRDLPAIDASVAERRELSWNEVAKAIQEELRPSGNLNKVHGDMAEAMGAPAPARVAKRGAGILSALLALALMAPGLAAIAALASIWLANRIGPTPGSLADLRAGVDALGVRHGAPTGVAHWLFLAAIALTLLVLVGRLARVFGRPPAKSEPRSPPPSAAVFVSYARANAPTVLPMIEAAKRQGREFWLDQEGIGTGVGWAGEIVRAIKGSAGVMVMCSKAAFESDHVKREIYLADRYRKRLAPVYIEQAEPPEDFEYFFAGVQSLNLFETPEAERPQALLRVLGAAP